MDSLDPRSRAGIEDFHGAAVIGGPESVRSGFAQLAELTAADEFILVSDIYDPDLRLRSLDIASEAVRSLPAEAPDLVG